MKESKDTPLARTRPELLKMCLKTRFFDFPLLSLFTFIFLIPLLAWIIFSNYVLVEQVNETNFLFMSLLIYLPYIPFGMIFGLGVAGALNYSKRLAFQEGANVISDFFHGTVKNLGMNMLVFFLIFFFYSLLKIGSVLVVNSLESIPATIIIGVLYAGFFVILAILFFVLTQTVLYKGSFFQFFVNGIRFLLGMFGWNILIFLLVLLPFLTYEFIPFSIAQYISIAVALLFYFGFSIFVFTLYSHALFDLTINDEYPEIYRKGLAKEKETR